VTHSNVTPALLSSSLRAFLTNLVDFAGLFPPAGLTMEEAVARYARYHQGDEHWMLGRFVLPVSRMEEFERAAAPHWRRGLTAPWRVSALIGPDFERELDAVRTFNKRHSETREQRPAPFPEGGGDVLPSGAGLTSNMTATMGRVLPAQFLGETVARIDAVEVKITEWDEMRSVASTLPPGVRAWFEIPVTLDNEELVHGLASLGQGAKLRTGGTIPEAIPAPALVTHFIKTCVHLGVPFKATAGLHHPIHSTRHLTYTDDGPIAPMHGFVNVFLAAAIAREAFALNVTEPEVMATTMLVLEEEDPRAFTWTDEYASWQRYRVDVATLTQVRETLATSFGSCSFDEPIAALRALNWM
jgi:hypothetical protein